MRLGKPRTDGIQETKCTELSYLSAKVGRGSSGSLDAPQIHSTISLGMAEWGTPRVRAQRLLERVAVSQVSEGVVEEIQFPTRTRSLSTRRADMGCDHHVKDTCTFLVLR